MPVAFLPTDTGLVHLNQTGKSNTHCGASGWLCHRQRDHGLEYSAQGAGIQGAQDGKNAAGDGPCESIQPLFWCIGLKTKVRQRYYFLDHPRLAGNILRLDQRLIGVRYSRTRVSARPANPDKLKNTNPLPGSTGNA